LLAGDAGPRVHLAGLQRDARQVGANSRIVPPRQTGQNTIADLGGFSHAIGQGALLSSVRRSVLAPKLTTDCRHRPGTLHGRVRQCLSCTRHTSTDQRIGSLLGRASALAGVNSRHERLGDLTICAARLPSLTNAGCRLAVEVRTCIPSPRWRSPVNALGPRSAGGNPRLGRRRRMIVFQQRRRFHDFLH
jgi:hypothetical protein